ncbi:MAG: major facilitator superfamily 1, partial [Rhodoferax sp.]|nr:major facilitator superfamily 1 [Rhodoferax sp.]
MPSSTNPELERVTAKAIRRLLPFLLLMYVLAFLDRANIGFAKQAFQLDTGVSNAAYAFGAGIFFIGYALLEVPSNLIMHKVGARAWMCRIMVSWGLVSAALIILGFNATFVPQFLLGNAGMPRRYYSYPVEFLALNVASSAGATLLAMGFLIILLYLAWALRYGSCPLSHNPWESRG